MPALALREFLAVLVVWVWIYFIFSTLIFGYLILRTRKIHQIVKHLSTGVTMALKSIAELQDGLDRVLKEVGETAVLINELKQEIADLKDKIDDQPALEAAIEAAVAKTAQIADALDALQPHDAPIEEPAEEPTA